MDTQAIPGGDVLSSFERLMQQPEVKKTSTAQSKIASLANSDGWAELKKVIDTWIESLEHLPVDPKTDDVTTIGFRYLASRVTIEYLKDLRGMPERLREIQKLSEDQDG